MNNTKQITFEFPALEECSQFLDTTRWGTFSIMSKSHGDRARQKSYTLNKLPEVIRLIAQCRTKDFWISQASFTTFNRKKVNLKSVGLNFVDIDYYTIPQLANQSPDMVLKLVHGICIQNNIPLPSLAIDSGQGLHVKWIHEPLPAQVLPKWNVVQSALVELFKEIGADNNAKDISRILRVVGSVNQKNQATCNIIDIQGEWDSPTIYPFEAFADNLLPYTSAEVRGFRLKTKSRSGLKRATEVKNIAVGRLSLSTLNWYRLMDLKNLVELRGGDIGDGMREALGFWLCNHYALKYHSSGMTDSQIWGEFTSLYRTAQPDKPFTYIRDKASHVLELMRQTAKGVKVSFAGKEYIPLYTPTNDYLINAFGITSTEQKSLLTIIDSNEKARRNTEYVTKKRRADGVKTMAEYNDERAQKIAHKVMLAKKLYACDLSQRQIAAKLGVSRKTVQNYLTMDGVATHVSP